MAEAATTTLASLTPELATEMDRERRIKTLKAVMIILLIDIPIYPASIVLDFFTAPDFLVALLPVRIIGCLVFLVFALVLWRVQKKNQELAIRNAYAIAWLCAMLNALGLDLFSVIPGGPSTNYYNGLTLLLIAELIAFPWDMRRMMVLVGVTIGQFNVVNYVFDPDPSLVAYVNANYFFLSSAFIGSMGTWLVEGLRIDEFLARKNIEVERARSDKLLLNILPGEVAEELKARGQVEARYIRSCSILFTDFVGFTRVANWVQPSALVESLDRAFSRFDQIVDKWGLEKLKTIGDGYMAAGGVLEEQPDHLIRTLLAGLEMLKAVEEEGLTSADGAPWRVRIGLHPGPVVAGVIGQRKFAFDLWGDTVNTASRLEAGGQPRSINMATPVFKAVEPFFEGVDRGFVPVRGKGTMAMTSLTRLRPEYSSDPSGRVPNGRFHDDVSAWVASSRETLMVPAPDTAANVHRVEAGDIGANVFGVLSELAPEDQDALLETAEKLSFRPGQVLVQQGQSLDLLLLVVHGMAAVQVEQDGVSVEVGFLGPGEVIGEMSFVSLEPASATVVAVDDVVVLRFSRQWMNTLVEEHPRTGLRLFHSLAIVLAHRLRDMNGRLAGWRAEAQDARKGRVSPRPRVLMGEVPASLDEAVRSFRETMADLERGGYSADDAQDRVSRVCNRLVGQAAAVAARPDGTFDSAVGVFFLRETFAWFMQSIVIEHMYARPPGSPLDYQSALAICRAVPEGHGPLGALVDQWFQQWHIASGLRACQEASRREIVAAFGRHPAGAGAFRVAMVSAGVAPGIFLALGDLGPDADVTVTCVDSDLGALSALGQRAATRGMLDRFTFVCEDLPGRGRGHQRLSGQHIVHLSTLAGGTDDTGLVMMLDEIHGALEPGGLLLAYLPDLSPEAGFMAETLLGWKTPTLGHDRLAKLVGQSAFQAGEFEVRRLPETCGSLLVLRPG
jgi:class 3 adenylate cyclase/CRP-like cAMP-binding protein